MTYDPYPGGQPASGDPQPTPGGYQPFPGGSEPPQSRPPAPPSVTNAVRLMFAGAGITAISFIIGLATLGSLKSQLRSSYPTLNTQQINSAASFAVGFVVVAGIIGVALWIWMALMCRRGHNWARITGTVFFAIDTIGLINLARPGLAVSKVFSVIVWIVGLAAVIMLWRRESREFFTAPKYPS